MLRHITLLIALLVSAPLLAAETTAPAPPAATPAPEATATTAPAAPAAATPAPADAASVVRAQFTTNVEDREPVDNIASLSNDKTKIYFFTELRGLAGKTVTHRWEYNGKVMYEQPFEVGSARWRTFTSKTLDPSWTGEWKVSVMDGDSTLNVSTFSYSASAPAAAAPAPAEPAAAPAPEKMQ
jgi:hypothetical protein